LALFTAVGFTRVQIGVEVGDGLGGHFDDFSRSVCCLTNEVLKLLKFNFNNREWERCNWQWHKDDGKLKRILFQKTTTVKLNSKNVLKTQLKNIFFNFKFVLIFNFGKVTRGSAFESDFEATYNFKTATLSRQSNARLQHTNESNFMTNIEGAPKFEVKRKFSFKYCY
jgi:hypothetical protein